MAQWDTAYINNLPDSAFAVILSGGEKDSEGKTTPRDLRKLPHHNADGAIDLPHLRNALARLPQAEMSTEDKAKAQRHLDTHAKTENVGEDAMHTIYTLEQELREREVDALLAHVKDAKQPAPVMYKALGYVAKVQAGQPMTFVANEESEDRMGDVINADGWQLEQFQKNPVFMWSHDYSVPPIGNVVKIGVEGKQLIATVKWDEADEFAKVIKGKYDRGVMRAVSVGFRPLDFEETQKGYRFKRVELLELSAVAVPAHPAALAKVMGERKFSIVVPQITAHIVDDHAKDHTEEMKATMDKMHKMVHKVEAMKAMDMADMEGMMSEMHKTMHQALGMEDNHKTEGTNHVVNVDFSEFDLATIGASIRQLREG